MLGEKVINAGVFGYGIDKTFLRAEKLMEIFNPRIVIFSFIPHDIVRCERSISYTAGKPYFEVEDNKLIRRNIPVPKPSKVHDTGLVKQVLGYSYFIHKIMMRTLPIYWLSKSDLLPSERIVHSEGEIVASLLFSRLVEIAKEYNIEGVYILVQALAKEQPNSLVKLDVVLNCLKKLPVRIVNLQSSLSKIEHFNKPRHESFFYTRQRVT